MAEGNFFSDMWDLFSARTPSGYTSDLGINSLGQFDAGLQHWVDRDIPILSQIGKFFGYSKMNNVSDSLGQWYEDSVMGNNSIPEYAEGLFASLGQEVRENRWYNMVEAQKARDFSSAEAEKTRNWQRLMRQTAYQDTIADMQKAGLNPILAYQQGVSSTPTGSTAQGFSASSNNTGGDTFAKLIDSIANLISSAGSLFDISGLLGLNGADVTVNPTGSTALVPDGFY